MCDVIRPALSGVYHAEPTRGEQEYKDLCKAVENNPEVRTLISQLETYYDRVLVSP